MDIILAIIGMLLFMFVAIDIIWTTLWVDGGAGPLTNKTTTILWKILKIADQKGRVLKFSGPIILVSILLVWVVLSWISSFLILLIFEEPLINTINNRTLNAFDLFYFTGYTLFTFGNGEFAPSPGAMQILSDVLSGYGMVVLSLGISYVLGVIDGVVQKRSVASIITAIGQTTEKFLFNSFDGEKFYDLSVFLNELSSDLGRITAKQKAYPLLNYYHTNDETKALSYVLPIMADALWVLQFGLKADKGLQTFYVKKSLAALEDYLSSSTIFSPTTSTESTTPSLPDYQTLERAGIPLVDRKEYEAAFKEVNEVRIYLYLIKKENFETVLDEFDGQAL